MRIVIASDKFKGSLTAAEVAEALTAGLRRAVRDVVVERVPVADGGDGTLAAALEAGYERCPVTVDGPTGEPVETAFARQGDLAVVELADASGLLRLPGAFAPLTASTIGTGQLLAAAIDAGCRDIVLGVGGSCSTDGGAGLAVGLGARILDASGRPLPPGGAALASAAALDLAPLRARLSGVRVTLACDVDNPLLGPSGAAAVYGPQKGAAPDDVAVLEKALTVWAGLVAETTARDLRAAPGAGAAGGAGFGALALLDAAMRPGVETVLSLVDFEAAVADADLVITGEGSLDEQTLHGKAPVGVAAACRRLGVPVVAVCGRTTLAPDVLKTAGFAGTWALTDLEPDPARCMEDAWTLLERTGATIGDRVLSSGRIAGAVAP
ncbi:glycerate kinase [Nocardioides pantholopis]|uniref:glycerate kinase n=1 Tax=Nocardioides pantholopis TaxID=2483798 RepID=UPI0019D1FCA2|nr:glycerate kinase [Nocardioides pantholopis]